MKKLFKALDVNVKDNWFVAYSKGAAQGYISGALVIGAVVGVCRLMGVGNPKEELNTIEETEAE